jgi:hypothetical protein
LTGVNGIAFRVESVILHQSTKKLQRLQIKRTSLIGLE